MTPQFLVWENPAPSVSKVSLQYFTGLITSHLAAQQGPTTENVIESEWKGFSWAADSSGHPAAAAHYASVAFDAHKQFLSDDYRITSN